MFVTRRRLTGAAIAAGVLAISVGAPLVVLAGLTGMDLSVAKSHQGNFTVGTNGTFTVTFSAASVEAFTSVSGTVTSTVSGTISGDAITATDTLPNGLSYVTAGGGTAPDSFSCSNSGQLVTCTATPSFTQGDTFTFTVVAGAASSGTFTNSVSYSDSFGEDTNSANNSATDVVTVDGTATTPVSTPTPTPSTSTSTAAVSPTTIAAPSTGGTPGGGFGGAGLLVALLACGGLLGSALGVSAWRRR